MKALVTGGAGFIGSHLIQILMSDSACSVLNVDKLGYASNLANLKPLEGNARYRFAKADITDSATMTRLFTDFQPDVIFHLAAESHVDRSIHSSDAFVQSNIVGTHVLLETARAYWEAKNQAADFRFVHVSTDEVYGSLGLQDPAFTETTPYAPNSPYSASKAASDHLARAWYETYKLPVIITHCSNNYGPYQFTEKLIPLMITNALAGKDLPVYGNGKNIRDWIHASDHAAGLIAAYKKGKAGEVYNFGGDSEVENISIVKLICKSLDELKPSHHGKSYSEQIRFVTDRKGHDFRYAINNAKANKALGWRPEITFATGLMDTIKWYLNN